MSTGEVFLLVALILLLAYLSRRDSTAAAEQRANRDAIGSVEQRLDSIERMLSGVQDRLDDLPVSPQAKDERRFDVASPITAAEVRKWAQGETMRLMSKSYYYPDDEPVFHDLEYRHERIDDTNPSQFGYEVHGFWRATPGEQWEPYKFLATENECTTSSCEGAIRRLF